MAIGAAGDGFLRGYQGCIPGEDMGIQRRPYHKNCKCALHKSRGNCTRHSQNKVSYPIRRSWSESSLQLMADSTQQHYSGNSIPSPQAGIVKTQSQFVLFREDDEKNEDLKSVPVIPKSKV